ncbi:tetratricopeptide repeat protein [Sphingomonas arenae]|uniref:tetratricopeptide repeat protein n=1 Tax=Sphingomonas arenae TaxID=2812555 RepID=UPI0019675073|nr:hypothetical protein [Sphingomonas arenae]
MILVLAAVLATAQPQTPPAPCPDIDTPVTYVCRAVQAQGLGQPARAAEQFEKAAAASPANGPERDRALAAAGNMWIAADQPGKAALALDRALAGTGLQAEQRGEALLDRARAAEAQNDLTTARTRADEAAAIIGEDPFLWYFSAALAIREGNAGRAKDAIGRALTLAPNDALVLFEAGHVYHFAGDVAKAREYWTRAAAAEPNSPTGKAAREALALLDAPAAPK